MNSDKHIQDPQEHFTNLLICCESRGSSGGKTTFFFPGNLGLPDIFQLHSHRILVGIEFDRRVVGDINPDVHVRATAEIPDK